MALDGKTGKRLWVAPSEEHVRHLWAAYGNLYGDDLPHGILAWDAQTGALLSSYQFGNAFRLGGADALEFPEKGLVCARRETGVRAVEIGLASGGDRAEYATAALVRCLVATGRAELAWRLAARSLWENEARDTPFMQAAALARATGNDRRGNGLITHAASRFWGPSTAAGRLWEARASEHGNGCGADDVSPDGPAGQDPRDVSTSAKATLASPPAGRRQVSCCGSADARGSAACAW